MLSYVVCWLDQQVANIFSDADISSQSLVTNAGAGGGGDDDDGVTPQQFEQMKREVERLGERACSTTVALIHKH